jgi:hypothetical protein
MMVGVLGTLSASNSITINNDVPFTTTDGQRLPISDGNLRLFGGRFWLHGAT